MDTRILHEEKVYSKFENQLYILFEYEILWRLIKSP